jgi:hypothetical protein
MGKRSNYNTRMNSTYDTPASAVAPLLPHLSPGRKYVEPCAGRGELMKHLSAAGHACVWAADIAPRREDIRKHDMLTLVGLGCTQVGADMIITNPPWDRELLHPFLTRLRVNVGLPAWLLFDAGWMFTAQAAPFLPYVSRIVTVGRVKWIDDTKHQSMDDCAWYLFRPTVQAATLFFGKPAKEIKHGIKEARRPVAGNDQGHRDAGALLGRQRRPRAVSGAGGSGAHDA